MSTRLTLTRPDDWHLHLRDGAAMAAVVGHSAARFARAIVMPNLQPPVVETAQALAYRRRILEALPAGSGFRPLMTLYLTDRTDAAEIARAAASGMVHGVKLYPAGATTHSDAGVTDVPRIYPVLEAMAAAGLPLLVHGEVTDPGVDLFDRERVFIDRVLAPLVAAVPGLKVVLEHVTTRDGVQFVEEAPPTVAGTLTAHHLLLNRNALFAGGLNPHHYCLPVLKRERHREALVAAATGGNPRFFLGTDSAPHPRAHKECGHGCAGLFTAHVAVELYAEVFEQAGALDRLEAFAAFHGADFYGLPRNTATLTLERRAQVVPAVLDFGGEPLVPFRAGESVSWTVVG